MKKIIRYFLQGLLYSVPIAVTGFVIYKAFDLLNGILQPLLDDILPFKTRVLGIVILMGLVSLVGYLGTTIMARPAFAYFDKLIERAPLVKIIYSAIKDLMSAFMGTKKSFDKPVLVKLNRQSDVQKLGFITTEDLSALGLGKEFVCVYLPHSYAFSGNHFIVPRENITVVNASSTTVMKFIVSGGVTEIDKGKQQNI